VFNDLRLKSEAIAVLLPAEYRLAKKLGVEFTGGIVAFANSDEVLYFTLIGANIIIPAVFTKNISIGGKKSFYNLFFTSSTTFHIM
jgi:hypothetical protein